MNQTEIFLENIDSKIYLIRSEKVMLDYDLASLYEVPTMRLNEQVRRNAKRFPSDFMFPLSDHEFGLLISQIAISKKGRGGRRTPPLAFTEQGVAMLSAVLKSDRAIDVNIAIMRAFVRMREVLNSSVQFEKQIAALEAKYDHRFKVVFTAIRKLMSDQAVPRKRVIGLNKSDV